MFDFDNVNTGDNTNLTDAILPLVGKSFLTMENLPKIFNFLFDVEIEIKLAKKYSEEFDRPIYFINIRYGDNYSINKIERITHEYFVFNQLDDYYNYRRFEGRDIIEHNFIYVNRCFTIFHDIYDKYYYYICYNKETFVFDLIKDLLL